MTRVLFVCTGNVCRSPMAEAIARRLLFGLSPEVTVASAGLMEPGRRATAEAQAVMRRRGLDLSAHRSRFLHNALVPVPDLVVGMAAEHVAAVRETGSEAAHRAFALKELVRLGRGLPARDPGEPLAAYLGRIAAGRAPLGLGDGVADPIFQPLAAYERCAAEIEGLVGALVDLVWPGASLSRGG